MRPGKLRHEGEEDADQDGRPGQVLREQTLDDRGHQRRLRGGKLGAADPVELVRTAVCPVEHEERDRDDEGGCHDPDHKPELLGAGRRPDEIAGLQVLRRGPGVGRRDADDRADAESHGLVDVASPADHDEDDARCHQRRDRHPGDRVGRGPDDADDAG